MASASDLELLEKFAVGNDSERESVLSQLVPGTGDFFYYTTLHALNTNNLKKAKTVLSEWKASRMYHPKLEVMENRLHLLECAENKSKESIDFLTNLLSVDTSHGRNGPGQSVAPATYASALDTVLVETKQQVQKTLEQAPWNVAGFTLEGLEYIASFLASSLNNEQRRDLLCRIQRPDVNNLITLLKADLDRGNNYVGSFGDCNIHNQLTRDQLSELVKVIPRLINDRRFVELYLSKLVPEAEVNWETDTHVIVEYFIKVRAFVEKLSSVFNDIKANALFLQLDFESKRLGKYDYDTFLAYVSIPKRQATVNPVFVNLPEHRDHVANVSLSLPSASFLPSQSSDVDLVQDFLTVFFIQGSGVKDFEAYLEENFLKRIFATVSLTSSPKPADKVRDDFIKVLGGPPGVEELRNRTEITFTRGNKTFFRADEEVELDVMLKNVSKLTIKVFEINTFNYYKDKRQEIPSDINLDGLVANLETQLSYEYVPLHRHLEKLSFPQLKKRGVFVMELLGGGISSRAVIRKGRLQLNTRTSVAGLMAQVVDENNFLVKDASVWVDGQSYAYQEGQDEILIPFRPGSASPGRSIILCSKSLNTLTTFNHSSEQYSMTAAFYVDRESLLAGSHRAQVLVRPLVQLNSTPITVSVLKNVAFNIDLVDSMGVSTTKREEDITLDDAKELVRTFAVPDNTRRVTFTLTASVNVLSDGGRSVDLTASDTFEINGIDDSDSLEDVHLQYGPESTYVLKVLGKSGEPKANRVVTVQLQHRLLVNPIYVTLQSNDSGAILLGQLGEISNITATLQGGAQHSWSLDRDFCTLPKEIRQRVGTVVRVPFVAGTSGSGDGDLPSSAGALNRRQASLFQLGRDGSFLLDCFSHLSFDAASGYIVVDSKLTPGDYLLTVKDSGNAFTSVKILITRNLPVRKREDPPLETIQVELVRTKNPYSSNLVWQCDRCYVLGSGEVYHCPTKEYDLCISCYNILSGIPAPPSRTLQLSESALMQVSSLSVANNELVIQIANASVDTRVHVFCPRLVQEYTLLSKFRNVVSQFPLNSYSVTSPLSSYSSGRRLGDEQLYVLNRKEAKHRPGNMLPRPSLILNPFEIRSTETKRQEARQGEDYSFGHDAMMARSCAAPAMFDDVCMSSNMMGGAFVTRSTNVDWLAQPLVIACNLVPGPDGALRVPLASINALQGGNIVVFATNDEQLVVRHIRAPFTSESVPRDLRMLKPLSTQDHFTEQRRALAVKDSTSSWTTSDVATTTLTVYDNLSKVYGLLSTLLLNGKDEFAKFSFLPRWPRLSLDEKQRLYSEFACHELNFFLYRKDREFFNNVIRPYLTNKCQKTIVDRLLLGESLDSYSDVSRFSDLNVFEQVLLALGTPASAAQISQNLRDRASSTPIDLDRANFLFDTALKAAALDEASGLEGVDNQEDFGFALFDGAPAPAAPPPMAMMAMEAAPEPMARMARSIAPMARSMAPMMMKKRAMPGDMEMRGGAGLNQMYRAPDKTKELGERNYWQPKGEPVRPNFGGSVSGFWADVAAWAVNPSEKCATVKFLEACNSVNEALLVLAFLDIPFQNDVQYVYEERSLSLTSKEPFVVFSKQIQSALVDEKQAILVHENFFDVQDRYTFRRDGEREDKFLKDEALVFTVYGCRVVLTNVSSANQKLNLLVQVPEGAIPVLGSLPTRSLQRQVGPYSTLVEEYFFYFPRPGRYTHYPAHVAREGVVCGWAHTHDFLVVPELSGIDSTSWSHVASASDPSQFLKFLAEQNLNGIDLADAAWQMRDKKVFLQTLEVLRNRRVFSEAIWGYGFMHGDVQSIREYLYSHRSAFGPCVSCSLLTVGPEETYTHTEFDPVINARAHRLGEGRVILNDRIKAQYETLLQCLAHLKTVPESLVPAIVYHLLLQDRIDEGAAILNKFVGGPAQSAIVELQLDYLRAYMDFFTGSAELAVARQICEKYAEYPVKRWRKLFDEIRSQLAEIDTGAVAGATEENTASRQPSLSFTVENGKLRVRTANLAGKPLIIQYFAVDLELLFSSSPFMNQSSGQQFLYVKPNFTSSAIIPETGFLDVPFEEKYGNANVVVEISSEGLHASQPVFSNSLNVQVAETHGQVLVSSTSTGKPVAGAYVKVYAKYNDGRVTFYKDGYCDLRGRFDYVSLTTKEENIQRFAILVATEKSGSLIKEASPPSTLS